MQEKVQVSKMNTPEPHKVEVLEESNENDGPWLEKIRWHNRVHGYNLKDEVFIVEGLWIEIGNTELKTCQHT